MELKSEIRFYNPIDVFRRKVVYRNGKTKTLDEVRELFKVIRSFQNTYIEHNNKAKEYKVFEVEYKKVKEEMESIPEMKTKIEEFEKIRYEVQVISFRAVQRRSDYNRLHILFLRAPLLPRRQDFYLHS